ncbi:MAG: UvrD-helicase domain-containing protein [Christensenellales bacterium]
MENKVVNKYQDLTDEQQQVINHKSGNLLVSASAGSGKTKVLISKIVDIVLNKFATLKQLLVVTFTNDASAEMKIRLASELQSSNDAFLLEQLDDLTNCDILTFDKFCIKVVREFGYHIGVSNNFNVADDSLSKFLQSKALDNIFLRLNKNLDEKYNDLLEQFFGSRNFSTLKNGIIRVFNFLRSKSIDNNYYKNLLNDMYSHSLNKSEAIKYINNYIVLKRDVFDKTLNNLLVKAGQIQSDYLQEIITDWLQKVEVLNDDFENNYYYLCNGLNFKKMTKRNLTADETDLKAELSIAKDKFTLALNNFVDNKKISIEDLKNDIDFSRQNIDKLYDLVQEFEVEYANLKKRYQVLDFADLEIYAGKLLQNQDIKTALQNRYKYIFIDEYQDTNEIQDDIIKNISTGENLLMVGDVKQSIYRFRQAEPKIFLNKYNLYKDFQNTNSIVELNKNFRSESDVLNFANFVFDGIMQKDNSGIDYKNTSRLEFGGNMQKSSNGEQIKIIAVNKKTSKDESEDLQNETFKYYSVKDAELSFGEFVKIQKEAKIVANEILSLIGKTYYDAKTKSHKKIDFKDIAILSRKKSGVMLLMRDVLKKSGIPVNCTYTDKLYKSYDIQLIINILRLIENCQNDTALISTLALKSNNLSFDELAKIRAKFKEEKFFYQAVDRYASEICDETSKKIQSCFKKINEYRVLSKSKNLQELILHIIGNENLEQYFIVNNQGEEFNTHVSLLLNNIESIKNYSLSEFINYINTFAENISFDVSINDSSNSVKISTIHASKGLEFPVVFLVDTGSSFSNQSVRENILIENDFGISTKSYDLSKRLAYNSPINLAFKKKITDEERKEEMRLLYVALTRPKNYLTIVGTTDLENIDELKSSLDVLETDSYLKWILGLFGKNEVETLLHNNGIVKDCCKAMVDCVKYDFDDIDLTDVQENEFNFCGNTFSNKFSQIINNKFKKSNLVKKVSVSQIMEQEDHYNISDLTSKTSDKLQEDDFLLIGTASHKFMQLLNFNSDASQVLKQVENLKSSNLITNEEWTAVDVEQIVKAVCDLSKLIEKDDLVLKEQQFLCYYPAKELTNTNSDEKIIVQGIADLIIIKSDEIYLIDYKTSRISSEQKFKQKYATQLNIYAKAIQDFYGKKVTKKIIYSFYLGKVIII